MRVAVKPERRSRRRGCARDGRVFFHMAGGRPFGEFRRIAGVLGSQNVQRNGGFVRGVFQSAGGSGRCAEGRAFGGDGGFKSGDVRIEGFEG